MSAFSVGQQNQFEVICALSQRADCILLDEPFAGNDVFNYGDKSLVEDFTMSQH